MASLRSVPVSEPVVRRAEARDSAMLFAQWQRARNHNATMDRRVVPSPVSEDEFAADLREALARPSSATFVAELNGQIAGFIRGTIELNQPDRLPERHATIGYLYVDEQHRRRGIGRALFGAVAEWAARQEGVSHFEMTVLAADPAAADFWRSIGFTPFILRLWAPLSAPEPDP